MAVEEEDPQSQSSHDNENKNENEAERETPDGGGDGVGGGDGGDSSSTGGEPGEDAPLLGSEKGKYSGTNVDEGVRGAWWHRMPRSFASAVLGSLRWFFLTLASPAIYLVACFYDEAGAFAPLYPFRRSFRGRKGGLQAGEDGNGRKTGYGTFDEGQSEGRGESGGADAHLSDAAKAQRRRVSSRHSRSPSEEISPSRRSIRIKLSQDTLSQRENRRSPSAASKSSRNSSVHSIASSAAPTTSEAGTPPTITRTPSSDDPDGATDHSVQLKSPTSPVAALTRYPKTPAPPRPLVPRRQPSYLNIEPSKKHQKTLILDLDETLIHSMSKGGRMSTGHMVEVRLTTTYVGHGGQATIGPQHPILYWVNKRPHCDDFLRRVCKWYNLVIFTASVPEYADPVIDWLEQERKFFSGRYYRQHCTFRQGAFIKDLSSVEPDLSKVMILDNSPLSYMFHQDNAIPIQGWINDPTDNDLLHLVPLLEGLQYVSDVRALLALRGGEDGQHMA